jgi:hypothetical protein
VSRRHPDRYVIRSASTVVAFWIGIAVVLVVVGTPIILLDWRQFGILVAPALLFAWILWMVLYRPSVHYDSTRAVVVNIGRTHVLPWGHVTNVHQGIGMIFDLDAGKPVVAAGAPSPRRPGIIAGAIDRRTRPSFDLHHEADLLDSVRGAAAVSSDPVVSTWDAVPLLIGAVLAVAVVVEFAVGI